MTVQIISTENELIALENDWIYLTSKNAATSFFSSFNYIRASWDYFKRTSDRLFVLVVREEQDILGIAPLRISLCHYRRIPARVIEFIAAWEGDRPGIVSLGDDILVWEQIYGFLNSEFKEWDVITLDEQAVDSHLNGGWSFFHNPAYACERERDA